MLVQFIPKEVTIVPVSFFPHQIEMLSLLNTTLVCTLGTVPTLSFLIHWSTSLALCWYHAVFFLFLFLFFEGGLMYENILICPKLFLFFIIFYQLILTQILAYFNMLLIDQISENYSIFNGNLT